MQITLNGFHNFDISKDGDNYLVNRTVVDVDIQEIGNNRYQIIVNNQPFIASIAQSNDQLVIIIDHHLYFVETKEASQELLDKVGINQNSLKKTSLLKAPMPGLIVDILVNEGAEIYTGQALVVLKAMKMENIIKAPHDGVIKRIFVRKDQKIDKDSVILQF